jgi:hypothetical protein
LKTKSKTSAEVCLTGTLIQGIAIKKTANSYVFYEDKNSPAGQLIVCCLKYYFFDLLSAFSFIKYSSSRS